MTPLRAPARKEPNDGCDACRLTLDQWCAAGAPLKLCGLCRLMDRAAIERYVETWRPARRLTGSDKPS